MGTIDKVGTAEAKGVGLWVGERVVGDNVGVLDGLSSVGSALLVGLPVGSRVDTVGATVGTSSSAAVGRAGGIDGSGAWLSKPSVSSLLAAAAEEVDVVFSGNTLSAIGIATATMASKAITDKTMAHFNRRRVRSAFTSSCFSKSGCVSALFVIVQDYTE